jgi:hypothetical protein
MDTVTELVWEREPTLGRTVLIASFTGSFDAASASTGAVDWLVGHRHATRLARIDAEEFFDFQRVRPQVVLEDGVTRRVVWPENVVHATDGSSGGRGLLLLSGIEPHLRWRQFCTLLVEVVGRTGCDMVVTVGANPAEVPHTRMPLVFGSSTNLELATRFGLSRPQYQGPTGLVGALHEAVDRAGVPAIALRVGVSYYALQAHNTKATMALLRQLEHVTGVPTGHSLLSSAVAEWERRVDEALAADPEARAYVKQLEARYDRQTPYQVPSSDDLADELERFLEEHREDPQ